MIKPISRYIKEVEGWDRFPNAWFPLKEGEDKYFCSFGNKDLAIQVTCNYLKVNDKLVLHVSISPILSMTDVSKDDLIARIVEKSGSILKDFFGNLEFANMPDDPRNNSKHFFHYVESEPFSEN
jgi:hypothetical protein